MNKYLDKTRINKETLSNKIIIMQIYVTLSMIKRQRNITIKILDTISYNMKRSF